MKIAVALWMALVVLAACVAITVGAAASDVPPLAAIAFDVVVLPWGVLMVWMTLDA